MPNYSSNCIIISGKSLPEFEKTLNTADDEGDIVKFSFHQTIPMPDSDKDNWYHWRVNNWGTKWDVNDDETSISYLNDKIIIRCETAWSPPTAWACQCRNKFHDLDIEIAWCEYGTGYYGTWKNDVEDIKQINFDEEIDNDDGLPKDDSPVDKFIRKYKIGLGG